MGQSLIRPRSGYMRPDDVDLEEQAATAVDGPSETSEAGDAPPEAPPTNTYFGTEFRAEGGRTLPTVDATRAELGLGEAGVDSLFQPPKIHVTKAISCSVNLNDKTITIRRVATNPSQFILEFEFDADEAGSINLYFGVIEKLDASNNPTYDSLEVIPPFPFEKGLKQKFTLPAEHALDKTLYKDDELTYDFKARRYPIVIVLKGNSASDPDKLPMDKIAMQTVLCKLNSDETHGYTLNVMKIKLSYGKITYVAHEIYGSDSEQECVVCMTEPRTTSVLPCRHLCLCAECAEVLRYKANKCPICRAPVRALLKLNDGKPATTTEVTEEKTPSTETSLLTEEE